MKVKMATSDQFPISGLLIHPPDSETRAHEDPVHSRTLKAPRVLLASVTLLASLCLGPLCAKAEPDADLIARGAYLSLLGNCEHCHTPGHFLGKRDDSKALSGSDVGFWDPVAGTVIGPNITPDIETGIGSWSSADLKKALTTGERPDGRMLSPVMPWQDLARLHDEDITALVEYLKSLKPLKNQVVGPLGPTESVPVHTLRLTPPETGSQR
ncbi:cytochrome c [Rhizobium sp. Leaf262]|uniref:c-type cytochrome n=1 Tax=Rhizobium sp. Leaf262 TaxID=1736312 RepID=UPI001FCCEDB8|nr:cytochrome c [Rhizobium sp. Leaf262]